MQQTTHRDESRGCLARAERAFAEGDLRAASDLGWSAASHMVKAVAEARGWESESERDPWVTYGFMSRLARESSDKDLRMLFSAAGTLRTNEFYTYVEVDLCLKDLAVFLSRLEQMLPSGEAVTGQGVREDPEQPYSG